MIETFATILSTNAELAARVRRGEAVHEGNWLIADRQSAGRGRHGREWFDGLGNFMGSTVVRPAFGDPPLASLSLVAGLAVHAAVEAFVTPPSHALLKWPNDVMIGSAKLAGILMERVGDAVVIGIGVNLAQAPDVPDRQTIALSAYGPAPGRDHFAALLVQHFTEDLARWRNFGLAPILSRWAAAAHAAGTALAVGEPGEEALLGSFAGLTDDGALLLRLNDGTTRTIHAGEVRLAGNA